MTIGTPFQKQLEEFAAKVKNRSNEVVGGVVTAIVAKIDERSPVGDQELWIYNRGTKEKPDYVHWLTYNDPGGYVGGRFRGNWQIGVDVKPEDTLDRIAPEGSIETELAKLPEEAAGHVFWYVNNLPYAEPLENGWSTQAPTGMVSVTLAEFSSIITEQVAHAKAVHP